MKTLKLFLLLLFIFQPKLILAGPISKAKPWEIKTNRGETILPDIFYAEAFQNEQLSPLTLNNNTYQINRLIYPTLGNPNLFERYEADEIFPVVVRLEPDLTDAIFPQKKLIKADDFEGTNLFQLQNSDSDNQIHVYLIKRTAREFATTKESLYLDGIPEDVYEITPSRVYLHDRSIVPPPFNQRDTLRLLFNKNDLSKISAGLYDLRIEIITSGIFIDSEFQYNALRIFDNAIKNGYSFINISDTQISVDYVGGSLSIGYQSANKIEEFVHFINSTKNPEIKNAPFIMLNGDLHNGGSTKILSPNSVFLNYNNEANLILDILKNANYPIFLIPGNHDGITSFGHVPSIFNQMFKNIVAVVKSKNPSYLERFTDYLRETRGIIGGKHVDLYLGQFIRKPNATTFQKGWINVPASERNLVLYDGFYQWQKAYGPLYYSFKFGKNFYINLNTFELRQHKRSGWGMYLVNFGGGISPVQTEWIGNDLITAQNLHLDTILSSHHDPRGGHDGKDFPYYFKQLDYTDISSILLRFLNVGVLSRFTCNSKWIRFFPTQYQNCHHDGLHEWMHPDPEFDCYDEDKYTIDTVVKGKQVGQCRSMDELLVGKGLYYSGHQLINLINNFTVARTLLIGHLHYATLEVLQNSHEVIPPRLNLAKGLETNYFVLERANPVREAAYLQETANSKALFPVNELSYINSFYEKSSKSINRHLKNHELAILRFTSASQTTPQERLGKDNYGFALLNITPKNDYRNYLLPQVNRISYFQNVGNNFTNIGNFDIDRTKDFGKFDLTNPLKTFFTFNDLKIY